MQKFDSDRLWIVNSFVNKVGRLTSNQEKEISDLFTKFEKQTNTKATIVPKEFSSTGENTPRIKTKGELKETTKSMSMEESTSDEDGALEQQTIPPKGKKETQKPKVSKPIKEYCSTDKETIQQQSRTTMGIQKPTSSKSTTQQKSPEGKKQTQNAKRKLKDDDSTKVKSSRKKPRLMQEQQMNQHSPQLEAGKRTK